MVLANSAALQAASTYFDGTMLGTVFNGPYGYIGKQICADIAAQGKATQLQLTASNPVIRQWIGAKQIKSPRAFNQTINNFMWEKTIGLDRQDVEQDRTGSVLLAIDQFVNAIPDDLETLIMATLVANTALGIDGEPLLDNAHPFSNGTGNNITASALGFETYRAGKAAMRLFADEDGRPLNMSPTHLLVGPGNERTALEVTGADRPVPFSATAQDATSGIVAATVLPNVFQGEVQVMVSNKIAGGQWYLMDLSKPVKPIIRSVAEELHLVQLVNEENAHTFFTNEVVMSAQGYMGFGPGMWQTVYGRAVA